MSKQLLSHPQHLEVLRALDAALTDLEAERANYREIKTMYESCRRERDQLRGELAVMTAEGDQRRERFAVVLAERNKLRDQLAITQAVVDAAIAWCAASEKAIGIEDPQFQDFLVEWRDSRQLIVRNVDALLAARAQEATP